MFAGSVCWVGKKDWCKRLVPIDCSMAVPWFWLQAALQGFVSLRLVVPRTECAMFPGQCVRHEALWRSPFIHEHPYLSRDVRVFCAGDCLSWDFLLIKMSAFCMTQFCRSASLLSKVSLNVPALSSPPCCETSCCCAPPYYFTLLWGQILL